MDFYLALRRSLLLVSVLAAFSSTAQAQLRVVTYNPTGPPKTFMERVLKSIGEETRNGFAKPIDILLLQEQNNENPAPGPNNPSPDTQAFVTLLNSIYNSAGITYSMSNFTGVGGSDGFANFTQTLVYRTQTVELVDATGIGSISPTGPARQPTRFIVRPKGYSASANFYIYNSHYKSSQGAANASQRENEAILIRANSDALPADTHIIYAGDHNFYDSDADEPAVGRLRQAGNGQATDPINQVGTWHDNPDFALYHTQSPCMSGCGAGGGMDDRFDFQWVSTDMMDGEGLDYISGSYHAFGNGGNTLNQAVNNRVGGNLTNSVTFPGVSTYTKAQILDALASVTDHLPVVADYQLPAVMQAVAGTIPTLHEGDSFYLGVTVTNAANVLVALGADELDYSITSAGDVSGSYLNQIDQALGGGNTHLFALDTSASGMNFGSISVTSPSPMVENGTINIPISYFVAPSGDYDLNGVVDAADYVVWRNSYGLSVDNGTGADGSRNGTVDDADYTLWRSNFGRSASFGASVGIPVPEPNSFILAIGACLACLAGGTLGRWTRKN